MDFKTLNPLNVLLNTLVGNCLPLTNIKTNLPIHLKIYSTIVWLIELTYLIVCIFGFFNVSKEKALKDGTVNIVVSLEAFLLVIYLYNRKDLLRELIGELNSLLVANDDTLRSVTINTVKPIEKPLRIYTVASVGSLILWTSFPFVEVFRKKEFYYTDYRIPAVLSKEPFTVDVFIGGIALQIFGSVYTVIRKISLDVYTMHLMLLTTAQYKYLRIEFATILRRGCDNEGSFNGEVGWENMLCEEQGMVKEKMRLLIQRYKSVIELSAMLKKLLSPNIGLLYINNVIRFCFLSFMFATSSTMYFEKFLIISYTIGALTQFYVLCFCVQELFEASSTVADDIIHEKWYVYDVPLQHVVTLIILANKLECKLSSVKNINLNLPSFISILNQAYSVCLLFLKARQI